MGDDEVPGVVGGGEDGERTGSGKFVGNTGGLEGGVEFAEVIVSLKVGFFLAHGDTIGTPNLTRSFKGGQSVNNGTTGTGRGGSNWSGGSWGSSGRGSYFDEKSEKKGRKDKNISRLEKSSSFEFS